MTGRTTPAHSGRDAIAATGSDGVGGGARMSGAMSLALLSAYAVSVWLAAANAGGEVATFEPFPLGGSGGGGGLAARWFAVLVGLSLGWGIPGVPLALLVDPRLRGARLLARSLGLGFGYIFLVGLGWALVAGHAPHRLAFLVVLAIPCVAALRPPAGRPVRGLGAIAIALAAMLLLTAILWPKLHHESMNGDGSEAYELTRSLESHPFPRWELEGADPPRFGTPITVPLFTAAFMNFGGMTLLGRGELAVRIPFVSSLVILAAIAVGLTSKRGATAWIYAGSVAAVYILWNGTYVGYEPPYDLAEPAGTDTLTTALWLAGVWELVSGAPALGVGFMVLASGTTLSAPVLGLVAVAGLLLLRPSLGRAVLGWSVAAALVVGAALAIVGWQSGDWRVWLRQLEFEYWDDLVQPERRVPALPFVGQLLLLTGGLPLLVPVAWSRIGPTGRLLAMTGAGYLIIVLAGAYKNLHYLMPLPWVFLAPALEASGARMRLGAVAVLAAAVGLSWPDERAIRRDTIALGRESCVQGMDYEAAALAANPIYQALDRPVRGVRFAVSKHTWARYALEFGGADCVVGLSRVPPARAVPIVDGPATLWTSDVDRYARWRFHHVPLPSSLVFRRARRARYPHEPSAWTGRLAVGTEPGRSLLLTGFSAGAPVVPLLGRVRLLVPVPSAGDARVVLALHAAREVRLVVQINNRAGPEIAVAPGRHEVDVAGGWRSGWNILELGGADGVGLEWIEIR